MVFVEYLFYQNELVINPYIFFEVQYISLTIKSAIDRCDVSEIGKKLEL